MPSAEFKPSLGVADRQHGSRRCRRRKGSPACLVSCRGEQRQTVTVMIQTGTQRHNVAVRWGNRNGGVDQWCVHGRAWVACGRRKEAALRRLDARSRRRRRAFARGRRPRVKARIQCSPANLREEKEGGERRKEGRVGRLTGESERAETALGDWEIQRTFVRCRRGIRGSVGERDR
ncbi:hypothetical protein FKP32DRAFT_295725 [Trametes sanguinea]|nr:hypothetical protein FKP32DRAFT_295725 [Trametes sanguinea]